MIKALLIALALCNAVPVGNVYAVPAVSQRLDNFTAFQTVSGDVFTVHDVYDSPSEFVHLVMDDNGTADDVTDDMILAVIHK